MKRVVAANWKLNPETLEEARKLASKIEQGLLAINRSKTETVICAGFVFLPAVSAVIHFARLGAQNVSRYDKGAFTGEVSAGQLKRLGVEYVIVGHSERRRMGADDRVVNRKIKQVLSARLEPILCVGFGTKKSHANAQIKNIVRQQIKKGLAGVKTRKITIAYEPVWAISRGLGTGKAATPEHAAEISKFIKSLVPKARVIYGGSVDGKNAQAFANQKNISGALVGAASLVPSEFLQIIKAFA